MNYRNNKSESGQINANRFTNSSQQSRPSGTSLKTTFSSSTTVRQQNSGIRARKGNPTADDVQLDLNGEPKVIVGEILRNVSKKEGITRGRRLAYLNIFVKFLYRRQTQAKITPFGFSVEEICLCLRICLLSESTVIRSATIRVLRYLMRSWENIEAMNSVGIHLLIVRSLDVVLNNSSERVQAIRFCQEIMTIPDGAKQFPMPITRALLAIAFDGLHEKDKLHRSSISILCQLAVLAPKHFLSAGGVRVLMQNVFSITSPMILEAILGSLLHLLNTPDTRAISRINLEMLVAPLTDPHFKATGHHHESHDKEKDEREIVYRCSKRAIQTVLRSWSGIAHFCESGDHNSSGLQALIDALYIQRLEIRKTILDLLCEIVGLHFPDWTDEPTVALRAVDPSAPLESWRLQEGFIVEEANAILPHLAISTPNITKNHNALLVYCLSNRGLLDALVEVIVTSDTFISVRATMLLGQLLHLVDEYVPVLCFDPSQCIPSLLKYTILPETTLHYNSPAAHELSPQTKQHRALEAITILSALQRLKSASPMPRSLFLLQQMEFAGVASSRRSKDKFIDRLGQMQLNRVIKREIESSPSRILKESNVLISKDHYTWQWDSIHALLTWAPSQLRKVEDSSWRNFLRRLVDFYKPSNNTFARIELEKGVGRLYGTVGVALVHFLAEETHQFSGTAFLEELLTDIGLQLDELLRNKTNPHVCFFSPNKMESTVSQYYFLFLGKLTWTSKGTKILERGDIFRRLLHIICEMRLEIYAKLILSSIYYCQETPKKILIAALNSERPDSVRSFATSFLRILIRLKLQDFSRWGIELLVNQLDDKNKIISRTALSILEEAIHDKMFLESLISLRPSLSHLGDRGLFLLITFLSLPSGFKFLLEANFLKNEISKWQYSYNKRYVELVEVLVRDSVSTMRRGEDGQYPERSSQNIENSKLEAIFVPPHLYGQLAQHKPGFEILMDLGGISDLIKVVLSGHQISTTEETRELKAALWALSHMATSSEALPLIEESLVIESMVSLGAECPILSVRHTVFHCLCLISSTEPGSEILLKYEWHSMPRNHQESTPIWTCQNLGNNSTKRLYADLDLEMTGTEDDLEKTSATDETGSNILFEEEDDQDETDSTHMFTMTTEEPLQRIHQRSQSDSQTLGISPVNKKLIIESPTEIKTWESSLPSTTEEVLRTETNKSSSTWSGKSFRGSLTSHLRTGSWKWRRGNNGRSDSMSESTTSGVSSCGSSLLGRPPPLTGNQSDHVQTLSPIPSSASIATTVQSNPISHSGFSPGSSSSTKALTDPGRFVSGSPTASASGAQSSVAYRSMRRTMIRMPMLSDSDLYPPSMSMSMMGSGVTGTGRPMSVSVSERGGIMHHHGMLQDMKSGSLDRALMLTQRDLLNESKLLRANSSFTSLSTPSFRLRPESESKSPCYMGLCLPKKIDLIFILNEKYNDSSLLYLDLPEPKPGSSHDIFEFHKSKSCLGCFRLPKKGLLSDSTLNQSNQSVGSCVNVDGLCSSTAQLTIPATSGNHPSDPPKSSMVSIGSIISGGSSLESSDKRKILPDSVEGRTLIRKEVLKILSTMISSIGSRAGEQNLLLLRQKFPKAFKDLCLYSELCHILNNYNVRLNLRRFFQELFLELDPEEWYSIAKSISVDEKEEAEILKNTLQQQVIMPNSYSDFTLTTTITPATTSESEMSSAATIIEVNISRTPVLAPEEFLGMMENETECDVSEIVDDEVSTEDALDDVDEEDSDYIDLK